MLRFPVYLFYFCLTLWGLNLSMSKESELASFGLLQQTLHSLWASIILMKKETEKHLRTTHKHITPYVFQLFYPLRQFSPISLQK